MGYGGPALGTMDRSLTTDTNKSPVLRTPRNKTPMTPGSGGLNFGPGGAAFGSAPFTPFTGTTNPGGTGPIMANPGNFMDKPGNTSSKNLQTVLGNEFNYNAGVQGGLLNENENALNLNNLTKTPLYKANLEATRAATGTAYDQAMANARKSAITSGFGYAQPIAQGAETGIRGQAASEFGKAPAKALQQTVNPTLEAAQIRSGEMSQFDPAKLMAVWEDLVKGKSAASSQLMSSLFAAGGQLGSSVVQENPGGVFGP